LNEVGYARIVNGSPDDRAEIGDPHVVPRLKVRDAFREANANLDLAEISPDRVEIDVGAVVVAHLTLMVDAGFRYPDARAAYN
jgi:hypothetical protein